MKVVVPGAHDNYMETYRKVAEMLLARTDYLQISTRSVRQLKENLAKRYIDNYLRITCGAEGSDAMSLQIRVDYHVQDYKNAVVYDEKGNEFVEHRVAITFNFGGFSTKSHGEINARFASMQNVVNFVGAINTAYENVSLLKSRRSAEEVHAENVRTETRRINTDVLEFIKKNGKRLRVQKPGKPKKRVAAVFENIPDGTYDVVTGRYGYFKNWSVEIHNATRSARIWRTS